jgi:DNA-binding IclR family transcriptional regulator
MTTSQALSVETYILDSLMVDLVGHDRRPSAYILYLALLRLGGPSGETGISLQGLATATGLSKTAVQRAVAHLARRGLVAVRRTGRTQAPRYRILQPWRR